MNMTLLSSRFRIFSAILMVLLATLLGIALFCARQTAWFWVLLGLCAFLILMGATGYFYLWKPYGETTREIDLIAAWPLETERYNLKHPYNKQTQLAMERIKEQLVTLTAVDLSKRQVQYQALQSQINPHFLYNTLESIRSEALLSGLESVAQMCESLATFFRYTISKMEDLVTLEEELQNVKDYFYIQQYRFGERLQLNIECDEEDQEEIRKCLIPKLTLQPIVENAIIHGIEEKIGDGSVTIKMVLTERRVIVTVSDDGIGMDAETLHRVNQWIHTRFSTKEGRGGIAISNVNNRIKLMFGESYGVCLHSALDAGTDVELTLPRTSAPDQQTFR